jgi:hypothetical protein
MRAAAVLSFLFMLSAASEAAAQGGGVAALSSPPFYISRDSRFAIIFPAAPRVTDIRYTRKNGAAFPAKQFAAAQGANRYTVTVVDFSRGPAVDAAVVQEAVDALAAKGRLVHQAEAEYEPGVGSRQLMVSLSDDRQIQASVYMWNHRLWITEGIGTPGTPALVRFTQSLTLFEADGSDVQNDAALHAEPPPAR